MTKDLESGQSALSHKWRRRLFRLILLAGSCAVALALVEGLATAMAWWKYGTTDVAAISSLDAGNAYISEVEKSGGTFSDILAPHPWLAYVNSKQLEELRPQWGFNNVGLAGPDYPVERDETKFTILLTGGSVAQHLCMAGEGGKRYLEQELNEKYQFGKPVVVLNGGNAAWNQPQQAILAMLYGEVVDAVVTLDGFNESSYLKGTRARLEQPSPFFTDLNPIARDGFDRVAAIAVSDWLRRFAAAHPWRSVYFATRAIRKQIEGSAKATTPEVYELFTCPEKWQSEKRIEFNLAQYRKYIQSIDALSKLHGTKSVHFIQPCPAIGKVLTEQEKINVRDLSYADAYRHMEAELMKLNDSGTAVVSLLNVFESVPETIYVDPIHCGWQPGKGEVGYRIMSEAIAKNLAEQWKIAPAKPK